MIQAEAVACERCGWSLAIGEVMCSRCGADAPGAQLDSGRRMSIRDRLTQTLETQLVGTLRSAVVGEYEILGRLGRGGMCAVYVAQDLALNRRVAIKVVLPELVSEFGIAQRRLMREARTAASLSHPNIIPVYAVKRVDDLVFFVMKHIEGSSLSAIIKQNGALPVPTAISILRQLASGLEYAHQRGVIHRDIKPANIMIDQEGWAVLADFGIAKVSDGQEITATGAAIGTPCYMSPEQCSGISATMGADQYSLGVVAYEMLTGSPPFLGDSVASVITKHLFERPTSIEKTVPDCPSEVSRVVARMLAKNPDERYPSVKDALLGMGDVLAVGVDTGRAHMIELANSALASSGDIEYSTPRSPNAFARNSADRALTTTGGKSEFRRWIVQRTLAAVGVVAVSLSVSLAVGKLTEAGSSASVPTVVVGRPLPVAVQPSSAQAQPTVPPSQPSGSRERASPNGSDSSQPVRTNGPSTADNGNSQAEVPAAKPSKGEVLLGTRGIAAVLYVNGEPQGVMEGLKSWPVPAGTVRLSVRADGCMPWDSTVVVRSGQRTRVGYRQPQCAQ